MNGLQQVLTKLSTMLEGVTKDAEQAAALLAVNRRPSYDMTLISKFDNTRAANAFGFIRNQLTHAIVLALARIWDDGKLESNSIPHMLPLLREATVIEALAQQRRASLLEIKNAHVDLQPGENLAEVRETLDGWAEESADQAEQELRETAPKLVARIDAFVASEARESIINFRHKYLAHSLDMTQVEKRETIQPLRISDIEKVLSQTADIVVELNRLIARLLIRLSSIDTAYTKNADDFWNRFA